MTADFAPIQQHSHLLPLLPGLWIVNGALAGRHMPRTMVVYRLADGSLLIHSAIALDEVATRQLEALGRPSVMIVPSAFHRLDAPRYKARYPGLKVVCPALARGAVEKVVPVDATCEEFLPTVGVAWHAPDGVKPAELIYEFSVAEGFALATTDLMMNMPPLPGIEGLLLKLLGAGQGLGTTRLAKLLLVKDKARFRAWLVATAARPGLAALIVAHGEPLLDGASEALKRAGHRL